MGGRSKNTVIPFQTNFNATKDASQNFQREMAVCKAAGECATKILEEHL